MNISLKPDIGKAHLLTIRRPEPDSKDRNPSKAIDTRLPQPTKQDWPSTVTEDGSQARVGRGGGPRKTTRGTTRRTTTPPFSTEHLRTKAVPRRGSRIGTGEEAQTQSDDTRQPKRDNAKTKYFFIIKNK
jgi:hypothetical protein